MDNVFIVILFGFFVYQSVLNCLLLTPKSLSLPVAQTIFRIKKNKTLLPFAYAVAGFFLFFFCVSLADLSSRGKILPTFNTLRNLAEAIDCIRTQFIFVLGGCNLILLLTTLKLSELACSLNSNSLNLEALKRQVTGLQDAYTRLSSTAAKDDDKPSSGEAAASREKQLEDERNKLKEKLRVLEQEKGSALASVTAMTQQVMGMAKEFDRLLDENFRLSREVAQLNGGGSGGSASGRGKKDD